jgi:hypothetical protein
MRAFKLETVGAEEVWRVGEGRREGGLRCLIAVFLRESVNSGAFRSKDDKEGKNLKGSCQRWDRYGKAWSTSKQSGSPGKWQVHSGWEQGLGTMSLVISRGISIESNLIGI